MYHSMASRMATVKNTTMVVVVAGRAYRGQRSNSSFGQTSVHLLAHTDNGDSFLNASLLDSRETVLCCPWKSSRACKSRSTSFLDETKTGDFAAKMEDKTLRS